MIEWLNVLVFADGSTHGIARALSAREICLTSSAARLNVYVPLLMPVRSYGYGAAMMSGAYDESRAHAQAQAEQQLNLLRDALMSSADKVRLSLLAAEAAFASRVAASLGRSADLVVIGQQTSASTHLDALLLQGALMGSGRPCLVLPAWPAPRRLGGRAVIAWKGTPEAARAVRDSLPLLQKAERVRIFAAGEEPGMEGEGADGLTRLAGYLTMHGVVVEPPALTAPPDELTSTAGDAILAEVEGFGADLLVMGGFGHSRWSEVVFGGATVKVLREANCAVLMSH
jgi:nucleotide-binding universal stress UspA family protein